MTTVADRITAGLDYYWANLKNTQYPQRWPRWVETLQAKIELWLTGEEFEFLEFTGDALDPVQATRLQLFGLTKRFALLVIIEKNTTTGDVSAPIAWNLVDRKAITSLEADQSEHAHRHTLVLTAEYDGFPTPVTFPAIDDYDTDLEARKTLFIKLRDDLYPVHEPSRR